jgi:hypothetical protein
MSCPLNRNRFAGSGYCKETATTNTEMDARLKELMNLRSAQDTAITSKQPIPGSSSVSGSDSEPKAANFDKK